MTRFFEGDDVTRIDSTITINGTGSEDYFNGGSYDLKDHWDHKQSTPLSGCLGYGHLPTAHTAGYR